MSESRIFEKVLLVGVDYKIPKGGVTSALNAYSTFTHPFEFVRTAVGELNNVQKVQCAVSGYLLLIWKLFTSRETEIVHIHPASGTSFWRRNYAIKIAKMMGKKVVFHCYGGGFKEFRLSNIKKVDAILVKIDCVVCLPGEQNNYFQNIGCRYIVTIKNVIREPNTENVEKDGVVHFLFLGLICNSKGIFNALKAIGDHKQELQNRTALYMGGDGETDRLLSIIKKLGIEASVRLERWVGKEKEQYLSNLADIYILPSFTESVSISILEVESYHKPVIATNVGGIPPIVQDCVSGVFATPGNNKEIYLATRMMAESEELRQKYGEASYRINRGYQPEATKKELTGRYNKILKTSNIGQDKLR